MANKFSVGDKVIVKRLNERTPKYIRDAIRLNRRRTVVGIYYDQTQQHTLYHVGSNNRGEDITNYGFRASELQHPILRTAGRPRTHRRNRVAPRYLNGGDNPTAPIKALDSAF